MSTRSLLPGETIDHLALLDSILLRLEVPTSQVVALRKKTIPDWVKGSIKATSLDFRTVSKAALDLTLSVYAKECILVTVIKKRQSNLKLILRHYPVRQELALELLPQRQLSVDKPNSSPKKRR